jgi:hypothetical protein
MSYIKFVQILPNRQKQKSEIKSSNSTQCAHLKQENNEAKSSPGVNFRAFAFHLSSIYLSIYIKM